MAFKKTERKYTWDLNPLTMTDRTELDERKRRIEELSGNGIGVIQFVFKQIAIPQKNYGIVHECDEHAPNHEKERVKIAYKCISTLYNVCYQKGGDTFDNANNDPNCKTNSMGNIVSPGDAIDPVYNELNNPGIKSKLLSVMGGNHDAEWGNRNKNSDMSQARELAKMLNVDYIPYSVIYEIPLYTPDKKKVVKVNILFKHDAGNLDEAKRYVDIVYERFGIVLDGIFIEHLHKAQEGYYPISVPVYDEHGKRLGDKSHRLFIGMGSTFQNGNNQYSAQKGFSGKTNLRIHDLSLVYNPYYTEQNKNLEDEFLLNVISFNALSDTKNEPSLIMKKYLKYFSLPKNAFPKKKYENMSASQIAKLLEKSEKQDDHNKTNISSLSTISDTENKPSLQVENNNFLDDLFEKEKNENTNASQISKETDKNKSESNKKAEDNGVNQKNKKQKHSDMYNFWCLSNMITKNDKAIGKVNLANNKDFKKAIPAGTKQYIEQVIKKDIPLVWKNSICVNGKKDLHINIFHDFNLFDLQNPQKGIEDGTALKEIKYAINNKEEKDKSVVFLCGDIIGKEYNMASLRNSAMEKDQFLFWGLQSRVDKLVKYLVYIAENGADEIILMNGRDEHKASKMFNRDILKDALSMDTFKDLISRYIVQKVNSEIKNKTKRVKISYVPGVKKVFNIEKNVNGKKTNYDISIHTNLKSTSTTMKGNKSAAEKQHGGLAKADAVFVASENAVGNSDAYFVSGLARYQDTPKSYVPQPSVNGYNSFDLILGEESHEVEVKPAGVWKVDLLERKKATLLWTKYCLADLCRQKVDEILMEKYKEQASRDVVSEVTENKAKGE